MYRIKFLGRLIILIIFVSHIFSCSKSKEEYQTRSKRKISKQWQYTEKSSYVNNGKAVSVDLWKTINIPHTWNAFDAVDAVPGYRRDTSWYHKSLEINTNLKENRILLYFEGSNITTRVFINGSFVGDHVGGYTSFQFDITKYVKKGKNSVLIAVDNAYNPNIIPSQKSDFIIYGGIIRDMYLCRVPKTYIKDVLVVTPKVNRKYALTEVNVTTEGINNNSSDLNCEVLIKNKYDKVVATKAKSLENNEEVITLPRIKKPLLWSTKDPNLYKVMVYLKRDDINIDSLSDTYGYRWFEFKENGAFHLNGKRLLLRGTHRHEEHAGLGAALPDSIHRNDIERIKKMGGNFVRLGHYPQDPEVYKACDELGVLVWDELPWCRGGLGGKIWKNNTERLLREIIGQNYNHPSIIIWSLGNEISWSPDFEGGGEIDSISAFLEKLNNIAHELDPYRLTGLRKYGEGSHIVDVFSPSIWAGWYAGDYKGYEKALKKSRKKYSAFLHMEYGGASHVGRHTEEPIDEIGLNNSNNWSESESQIEVRSISGQGDWSENYIVDLFDWHLHVSERLDWFAGNAQWALKDFATPLRPENPIPYINQKGLMDRAGKPKDAYYVFKSYWTDKPKFVYIESHTWEKRFGRDGDKSEVCVYSNCEQVELLINGTSVGKKKRDMTKYPAHGLQWFVDFKKGQNTISAVGFEGQKKVDEDKINIKYFEIPPKSPWQIETKTEKLKNGNLLIKAMVLDYDGIPCMDYNGRVYFSKLSGKGRLLKDYGTPCRSQVNETANGEAAIEFVPEDGERAVINVHIGGTKGAYIVVNGD